MNVEALGKNDRESILPPVGKRFIVQCQKFSCLGYRDEKGKWKNVFTNEELPEVMDFNPIN